VNAETLISRLEEAIQNIGPVAVAVSGGVDSMTLAFVAHQMSERAVEMFHAVSPAVPPESTARVKQYAQAQGWQLHVLNAGEFDDGDYMANPANRCFFCKTNLYGSMVQSTEATLVSGTNTDDLGDYRPGLQAADDHGVRHPYVDAGISKNDVRAIAHHYGLDDIAELPAAPCLSSRVETGIRIDPAQLLSINAVEKQLRDRLSASNIRCRVRESGIVIELDADCLQTMDDTEKESIDALVKSAFARSRPDSSVAFEAYRMGSAFLTTI